METADTLDAEITRYVRQGYHLTTRTATAAQLIRPKQFNTGAAILWFLVFGVGVFVYIFYYLGKRDEIVYLTADGAGAIQRSGSGTLSPKTGADRWECHACGYRSRGNRTVCKRCHATRP